MVRIEEPGETDLIEMSGEIGDVVAPGSGTVEFIVRKYPPGGAGALSAEANGRLLSAE